MLTLVDRSPEMLAVSFALNPECEHVVGDMRDMRLGRVFDCVLIHDAICYLTTEAELRAIRNEGGLPGAFAYGPGFTDPTTGVHPARAPTLHGSSC